MPDGGCHLLQNEIRLSMRTWPGWAGPAQEPATRISTTLRMWQFPKKWLPEKIELQQSGAWSILQGRIKVLHMVQERNRL